MNRRSRWPNENSNPFAGIERSGPGRIGCRIRYFPSLVSTQATALELAADGEPPGTVVIADHQTGGRGRMGRQWYSPPAVNLYLSVILEPRISTDSYPLISLVAGLAAAEALEHFAPGRVNLKWPNDLWLCGRKAGGILAEVIGGATGKLTGVILGMGINVNLEQDDIPDELAVKATSLRIVTGTICDRIAVAEILFERLDSRLHELEEAGFGPISAAWEHYSALTGKRVSVLNGAERRTGVVMGLDVDGALMLETVNGRERILAGDVGIEGAYD
jgi:BirA family biotin operon repressor/biotin-[acetyl-CoA-carboxylase] ligase